MYSQDDDHDLPTLPIDRDAEDFMNASCSPRSYREQSGFLTPSSDNALIQDDADAKRESRNACLIRGPTAQDAKKKLGLHGRRGHMRSASQSSKYAGSPTMADLLKDKFVAKPIPSSMTQRPLSLTPLALLPRSALPLSTLDLTSSILPSSRLFETHVKVLELEHRLGNVPVVLIARLDGSSKRADLIAVELESKGRYVLCPLGSWVDFEQLQTEAIIRRPNLKQELGERTKLEEKDPFVAPTQTVEGSKLDRKKRLAIEEIQSLIKRPRMESQASTLLPEAIQPPPSLSAPTVPTIETQSIQTSLEDLQPKQQTAEELFAAIRTQYMEALYISKTSLAYYAKGPLSRARAAFHFDFEANLNMSDLIEFLQSIVLPTTMVDKKYKTTLPEIIDNFDLVDHSADDAEKQPKRRPKKFKLGKNGLYPTEDTYIKQWWSAQDQEAESGVPGFTRDDFAKRKIGDLRVREIQLQMIVILEILSLQASAPPEQDELPMNRAASNSQKSPEARKSKKKLDLQLLIDVHIDRLCIWQSTTIEEKTTSSDLSQEKLKKATGTSSSDQLKDFCIEVIVPFYSSRLPERCSMINRRLGGPVVVSSARPPKVKSTSSTSRPGAAAKRHVPVKPGRSLEQVLSEERRGRERSASRGPSAAISLMRSATAPAAPSLRREGSIKREPSEAPSLSEFIDVQPLLVSRGGVLNSKRFSQREVDLGPVPKGSDLKSKKQAAVESELKEAISALRKPNRELAGNSFADAVEKRRAAGNVHPRKSKKPVRNPLFQSESVQILATPTAKRHKEVFDTQISMTVEKQQDTTFIPTSSIPRVEESARRSSLQTILSWQSPLARRTASHSDLCASLTVKATPDRNSMRASSFTQKLTATSSIDSRPPTSPLQVRRPTTLGSFKPSKPVQLSGYESDTAALIEATPVKNRTIDVLANESTTILDSSGLALDDGLASEVLKTEDDSIYKTLGWDDYDDLL